MNNNQVISIVRDLIEACRDGQGGFRTAADYIQNSEFRRLFNIFSQQRTQFVTELQSEVHRLGGDPEQADSAFGRFQRGWVDIQDVVLRGDEGAIIAECQRGEQAAIDSYEEALSMDLPLDVQYVV